MATYGAPWSGAYPQCEDPYAWTTCADTQFFPGNMGALALISSASESVSQTALAYIWQGFPVSVGTAGLKLAANFWPFGGGLQSQMEGWRPETGYLHATASAFLMLGSGWFLRREYSRTLFDVWLGPDPYPYFYFPASPPGVLRIEQDFRFDAPTDRPMQAWLAVGVRSQIAFYEGAQTRDMYLDCWGKLSSLQVAEDPPFWLRYPVVLSP